MHMKKLACLVLAVLLTLLTGCSQITETISSAIENRVGGDKEEIQVESENVYTDENQSSVSQLEQKTTPTPMEEEEKEGLISSVQEKIEEEKLRDQLNNYIKYHRETFDKDIYEAADMDKEEWINHLLDVKKEISEKDEIYHPAIEYNGKTYELRKTIDVNELRKDFPSLVEVEPRSPSNPCRRFGDYHSDFISFTTRSWTYFLRNDQYLEFLPHLEQIEYQGEYLVGIKVAEEGASVNGISVGDSREKIFKKYPMLKDEDQSHISLYYYDGQVYTQDEYVSLFKDYDRCKSIFGDIDIEHCRFIQDYNIYVLGFEVCDDEIECFFLCDNHFATLLW